MAGLLTAPGCSARRCAISPGRAGAGWDYRAASESATYSRTLGRLRCADVMSREPISMQFGTSLNEAWELMRVRKVKALPVTDRAHRIVGIITQSDLVRAVYRAVQPAG